jgi:hypothetical protein
VASTPDEDEDTPIQSSSELKSIPLNSNEEMYAEIRDKNFNAVGPYLSRKAKAVQSQFAERHDAKSVRELKNFVDKLPQMKVRSIQDRQR